MKNSSKKALEKRGIVSAGRAAPTPGARTHDDKRRANRKTDKQRLKFELQKETARNSGPFPFGRGVFVNTIIAPKLFGLHLGQKVIWIGFELITRAIGSNAIQMVRRNVRSYCQISANGRAQKR